MIRGGHGWSDVIDLTGHLSLEGRERFREMDRNRDVAEEALTDRSRERVAESRWMDRVRQ